MYLVGCRPWGREESDTTERLPFHFSLSCIGEGNGNPLQCSCLENPRDGGAWWVASMGSHRVGHDCSDLAAAAVPPLRISEILETTVLLLVFVTSAKNSDELSPHEIECFSLYCFKNYWPRQYILKHVTSIACLPSPLTVLVP